jgi:hypothetical protein
VLLFLFDIAEEQQQEDEQEEQTELWIDFTSHCEDNKAQLVRFIQQQTKHCRVKAAPGAGALTPDLTSTLQGGSSGPPRARVVVFGQSFDEDVQVARSYARAGHSVLLLTSDNKTLLVADELENFNMENLKVVCLSNVTEDIFLFVNTLLEMSFSEKQSADIATQEVRMADGCLFNFLFQTLTIILLVTYHVASTCTRH